MEAAAPPLEQQPALQARRKTTSDLAGEILTGGLAFALTVYAALSGGAYDIVVRSEIGILIWWLLLLGLIAGFLPRSRLSRATSIALIPLAGFFAWTWLATGWTTNQELTLTEAGRVATYAGVFLLGASVLTRASAHGLLGGLAAGISVVCALAVLSKLVPSLFPTDPTAHLYATTRLRYPFDYSDGVGEFAALGLPPLIYFATAARSLWARALAASAVPVVLLCLAMTVSRGGILAAAVGIVVLLALAPDRPATLATGALTAAGTAVLMLALLARRGLTDRLFAAAPAAQRHSMLYILVGVVALVGLLQAALALAARRGARPDWTRGSPGPARLFGLGTVLILAVGIGVFMASGAAHHVWEQFKQPNPPTGRTYFRLLSVAGSHRYQYWEVAIRAFHSAPWTGIGPGTFQFYWAQHQTLGEYILNAHSLWIETLAELGIVGLALITAFFLFVLIRGAALALAAPPEERLLRVAAVGGVAAFCAAAGFDWVWQIAAVPIVTMLLCAICVSPRPGPHPNGTPGRTDGARLPLAGRLLLLAGALAALWAIIVPLGTTIEVRRSQTAVQRGQLMTALRDVTDAQVLEPAAASPRLQRALILEQLNDIPGAAAAIRQAESRSPTDWQVWLVGSRIATEQNLPRQALADYLRARSLNPRSPIFGG